MAADFYSEIEAALADYLRALPELADVRTIESDVREAVFEESAGLRVKAFRPDELPAINLSAQLTTTPSRPRSAGRIEYEISLFVAIVLRATKLPALREEGRRIQRQVEAALHRLRASSTTLGPLCHVTGDVVGAGPVLSRDDGGFSGVMTIEALIRKVVEIGE